MPHISKAVKVTSALLLTALMTSAGWAEAQTKIGESTSKRRIVKTVKPIPFWVDADQLRVRDNPIAGEVVGLLELGQKVEGYEQQDNWVRISRDGQTQQWVNTDFLSNTAVTWARHNGFKTGLSKRPRTIQTPADVILKRLRVPENKNAKIFVAQLRETSDENRVIITKHIFRGGTHFEKRLVRCEDKHATHEQLLGEGFNIRMLANDPRARNIDPQTHQAENVIDASSVSPTGEAITEFACNKKPF